MRIVQITSDWKWTGPAEPMLRLADGLAARGHDVALACPEAPVGREGVAAHARAAGREPALLLERGRGVHPWRDRRDAHRLARFLADGDFDLAHAWHSRDHALLLCARHASPLLRRLPHGGGLPGGARHGGRLPGDARHGGRLPGHARRGGRLPGHARRDHAPRIVRSLASAEPLSAAPWNRWLFGPGCDGLWCVSPGAAQRNANVRGGRPCAGGFGAVDVERFQPAPADPGVRKELGLDPEDRVVGIVARAQRHRRFELLLEAARRLFERDVRARLLVVGRGTHRADVAEEPARRLGLGDRVVFAGYRKGDYADVLRAIDVFTLLVPGSDGTCRAVLEAAACGIPAVTLGRGALPEIVVDGETGFVVEEDPDALAGAWARLLGDRARAAELGTAARRRAESLFAPERMAEGVETLYRRVLEVP